MKTSTFGPEFGRMPGAQVLVTTRSGSDNFHGELSHAFRHEDLSARDFFAQRARLARTPLRLNDFNFGAGGPVQKNRMFFFGAAEVLRLRQPSVWRTPAPSNAVRDAASGSGRSLLDAFSRPERDLSPVYGESTAQTAWSGRVTSGSFRIDRALGQSGALFLRYHDAASANRVGLAQQNESSFRTCSFTAGITHHPGLSIVNDVRFNFSRTSVESSWFPGFATETTLEAVRSLFVPPSGNSLERRLYGLSVSGLGALVWSDPNRSSQGQFQLTDTLAISSGRHQVRIGLDYLRLTPSRKYGIATALAHFESLGDLLARRDPQVAYAEAPGGSSLIEVASAFAQATWSPNRRLNVTYGLRWEYMPPPSSRAPRATPPPRTTSTGSGETARPPDGGAVAPPGPNEFPRTGLFPAFTGEPVWSSRFGRVAPRVGIAYRLSDSGRFVLRAGGGVFYDLGFASAIDPLNSMPFNSWRTVLVAGAPAGFGPAYGFARDLRIPYSWQWNITAEGAAPGGGVVSAAWVGSTGRNLLRREGHLASETSGPALVLATSHGRSSYQAFQAHFRRRLASGFGGIVSYTWSHSIDNGSWDSGAYLVTDGTGGNQDRGASNFDVRHSFSAGFSYDLPASLTRIARGWSLHGILRVRSGFPIDVLTRDNPFGSGFDNAPRPDLVPGVPVWILDEAVPGGRKLNRAAFLVPASGRQGTLGRNAIRGNGMTQLDAALERSFTLPGTSALHLRVQIYNVANPRAVADPVRVLANPLFGEAASLMNLMLGSGRPTSGLAPGFQSGGPRTFEVSASWRF